MLPLAIAVDHPQVFPRIIVAHVALPGLSGVTIVSHSLLIWSEFEREAWSSISSRLIPVLCWCRDSPSASSEMNVTGRLALFRPWAAERGFDRDLMARVASFGHGTNAGRHNHHFRSHLTRIVHDERLMMNLTFAGPSRDCRVLFPW
jgi:hypothetical protein